MARPQYQLYEIPLAHRDMKRWARYPLSYKFRIAESGPLLPEEVDPDGLMSLLVVHATDSLDDDELEAVLQLIAKLKAQLEKR